MAEEIVIKVEDLQAAKVFVVGPGGERYRLQPSMRVGEFTLFQIPTPITPADMSELHEWVKEQTPEPAETIDEVGLEDVQYEAVNLPEASTQTLTPDPYPDGHTSPEGRGEARKKKK